MNALENVYNIGYLDGRNHVLALIALWSKKKKPETVLHALSNKETLEETLKPSTQGSLITMMLIWDLLISVDFHHSSVMVYVIFIVLSAVLMTGVPRLLMVAR